MLNCCIERRRLSKASSANVKFQPNNSTSNRNYYNEKDFPGSSIAQERTTNESTTCETERFDSQESSADDEEEFFEAIDSQEELERVCVSEDNMTSNEDVEYAENDRCEREGALRQFADFQLLESGEPLYVPITQVSNFVAY